MTGVLRRLAGVHGLVFDLDGTLYQDGAALPGAVELVRDLTGRGVPLGFVTNTTSRSRAEIARRMVGLGFPVEERQVLSPPSAAGAFLRERGASAWLSVLDAARPDFAGVREVADAPDFVVVGDLEEGWTFAVLNRLFRMVHGGAGLLALGRTRYWQTAAGLQLDVGPFVAALEYAAGVEATVFGKPEPEFFLAAVRAMGLVPAAVAVVGDDVRTDVGAAMAAGCRGVLVQTGKFRPQDLESGVQPDLSVASVAELA